MASLITSPTPSSAVVVDVGSVSNTVDLIPSHYPPPGFQNNHETPSPVCSIQSSTSFKPQNVSLPPLESRPQTPPPRLRPRLKSSSVSHSLQLETPPAERHACSVKKTTSKASSNEYWPSQSPPPPPLFPRQSRHHLLSNITNATNSSVAVPGAGAQINGVTGTPGAGQLRLGGADRVTVSPGNHRHDADHLVDHWPSRDTEPSLAARPASVGQPVNRGHTVHGGGGCTVRQGYNGFPSRHPGHAARVADNAKTFAVQIINGSCQRPCVESQPKGIGAASHNDDVVALSQWPLRVQPPQLRTLPLAQNHNHRELEVTHFNLSRVVPPKTNIVANEYVDEPSSGIVTRDNDGKGHTDGVFAVLSSSENDLRTELITNQPASTNHSPALRDSTKTFSKKHSNGIGNASSSVPLSTPVTTVRCHEGLVCSRCDRCRCTFCRTGVAEENPPAPCLICYGRYECSLRAAIDYCSCLCIVRTIFYHCLYHEDDDVDIVAEPCLCCDAPQCCLRWTVMGALLPCLPCLLCYCPLKSAVEACEACHSAGVTRRGCRCRSTPPGSSSATSSDATACSSSTSATTRSLLLD